MRAGDSFRRQKGIYLISDKSLLTVNGRVPLWDLNNGWFTRPEQRVE